MPAPIPDLSRDQQCHHYQAPTGQRCGSPALKSQYYCYHHHVSNTKRTNHRVLIDPEITGMEIPVIEDRASIFVALAAVIHRLAENTIDTRRAGQMIYGLQVAMRALEPPHGPRCRTTPATSAASTTSTVPDTEAVQPTTDNQQQATSPRTIPISKESLLYFLRSRHCASCNSELFPAEELTERRNAGAPPEVIEEARRALPAPETAPAILPTLNAVASNPDPQNLEPRTWYLEPSPQSTFAARFALHSPRRSVSLRLGLSAPCIPVLGFVRQYRILQQ
jgi:hypothetical protein